MKLLVFDGNSIINRAYYAIKNLTTKSGMPTGALHGFLRLYTKYINISNPDMVAVAFDVREKTFRHNLCADYKATRKGMPEELAMQMEPLKEILRAMDVCIIEKPGYEADDILGTLSAYSADNGYACDLVTGDRDALQLINENVRVILPVTRGGMSEVVENDINSIKEKYGIYPYQLIDVKAIMGDSSDNIKGVSGIGEKGALELIKNFGNLENIYKNLQSELIRPTVRNKLEADKESAFLAQKLARICTCAPIEIDLECMKIGKYDKQKLLPILEKYELSSIIKSMNIENPENVCNAKMSGQLTAAQIRPRLEKEGMYFIYTDKGAYIYTEDGAVFVEDITDLLVNDRIEKIVYDAKGLYARMLSEGLNIDRPFFDVMVAQYVIDPSANDYSIARLASSISGIYIKPDDENYYAACACVLPEIYKHQIRCIQELDLNKLLFEIEFPLSVVLADMELAGFCVDKAALSNFSLLLDGKIAELEVAIISAAGIEFNINSPKQLGAVLFEHLGLRPLKKNKTGYATGAEVLEKLSGKHEIIDMILEYRKYAKLKSTYCDGLIKLIDESGKIHTTFIQTVTQTGRISSSEPNLQNIPIRTEIGHKLRTMFSAMQGNILIDADYSQIELRVLAHIANDRTMLQAFIDNADIHTVTAAKVFNIPLAAVTPEMRRRAKAVNFGIVYGISDFSLSKNLKISRFEAKRYIDSYLEQYSGVKEYMHDIVAKAKNDGYVTTLLGRRRYLPELTSSNFNIRSFGERVALNMPIQGTAADIIKIAMVNIFARLRRENMAARLILQVHDELIIEAPLQEQQKALSILKEEMENAMQLNVQLKVDISCGKTWFECK